MFESNLSSLEIGERLRLARETSGITQADAAQKINAARTTIVAIEKGQRRIRIQELQQLAQFYGTSVNTIMREEAIHIDLVPRFRSIQQKPSKGSMNAVRYLNTMVRTEVELENILGIKPNFNYPPERPILQGNINSQAEEDSTNLRQWLGLGNSPIRDMVSLLELDLGIRVYVRKLDSNVSGLFAYDQKVGACMLLNGNHPYERREQTAAHELGHFISSRGAPEVLYISGVENSREERYANIFARNFKTPTRSVNKKFKEVTAGSGVLTRRHIIMLAHFFCVSREAMVRRLEELELTKPGSWDWFQQNGGITNAQAQQVLGDRVYVESHSNAHDNPKTTKLNLLIAEAWRQCLVSEGQLSQLLDLDRNEVRELLDEIEIGDDEQDGLPKLFN